MNQAKIIHNLRNPLNTIAMNAELGKLYLQKKTDPEKLLAIFDLILKECKACSEQLTLLKQANVDDQDASRALADIERLHNHTPDD